MWRRAWHLVLLVASVVGMTAVERRGQARDSPAASASGTGSIIGTVVADDESGKPLRNVVVSINGTSGLRELALTDDEGRFAIANLPAGEFILTAERRGYVDAYYFTRARTARGASAVVTLGEGERKIANLHLAPGAVIAGRILDAYGRPQRAVIVQAMAVKIFGGARLPYGTPPGNSSFANTDDTGSYRLYGLPPGDYLINATASSQIDARAVTAADVQWAQALAQRTVQPTAPLPPPETSAAFGYAPVFYPGTADPAAATLITLLKGEERQGIDFSLQSVPLARIEGTLVEGDRPVPGVEVSLQNGQQTSPFLINWTGIPASRTDAGGVFRFSRVLPGTYALFAIRTPSSGTGLGTAAASAWARELVTIGGDDLFGVSLRLQPGLAVSGRIVFEGNLAPEGRQVMVTLSVSSVPIPPLPRPVARVDATGGFAFQGLVPGRYRPFVEVRERGPSADLRGPDRRWFVKSVSADGVETLDSAFEITTADVSNVLVTLTDRPSELSGSLVGGNSRDVSDYSVVVFSTDRSLWTSPIRLRSATVDSKGAYSIINLPPGEYYLTAVTDVDPRQLNDAAFVESLVPRSIKITLTDGEKKKQDLKLSGGSRD